MSGFLLRREGAVVGQGNANRHPGSLALCALYRRSASTTRCCVRQSFLLYRMILTELERTLAVRVNGGRNGNITATFRRHIPLTCH